MFAKDLGIGDLRGMKMMIFGRNYLRLNDPVRDFDGMVIVLTGPLKGGGGLSTDKAQITLLKDAL